MTIREQVDKLVKFYKTRDPFEMIKGMNVILVYYPLENVRGFYQYFQRNNIIYIDERLPRHEQLFVLAHELGHMFLHKKSNFIFLKQIYRKDRVIDPSIPLPLHTHQQEHRHPHSYPQV